MKLQLGNFAPTEVMVSPYEIKTLRFMQDGSVTETNRLEE